MTNLNRVNHKDLVIQLEKYWRGKESVNLKTYSRLDECPEFLQDLKKAQQDVKNAGPEEEFYHQGSLPSDLIVVEKKFDQPDTTSDASAKKHKANYYTLFLAMSSVEVLNAVKLKGKPYRKIKSRLSFYLFYFSRIVEPKRFRIVNVFPKTVIIPRRFKKFCKDDGFGISIIDIEDESYTVEIEPKSLSDKIEDKFKEYIDNPKNLGETLDNIRVILDKSGTSELKEAVKGKAKDFTLFFEQYIIATTDAIAGIKPSDFGRRYLDKQLLSQMYELKNISYRDTIIKLVNDHLDEHMDDYQFVTESLSQLWKKILNIDYSDFLATYEPALLHVFAEKKEEYIYRDHYIHQFQVFLLGLYFIDCFYEKFKGYTKPEVSWLIAATFHDMAYPIQQLDKWMDKFFKEAFLTEKLGHIELESQFVKQGFLRSFNFIMEQFCSKIMKEHFCSDWLAKEDGVLQCFYEHITGPNKQHCLLSSISLLKLLYEKKPRKIKVDDMEFSVIFKEIIIPSALAIALHDDNIWGKLNNDKDWKSGRGNCPLPSLEFERDPLSFLLIFCDCAQEWGRPHLKDERKSGIYKKKKEEEEEEDLAGIFRLKNMEGSPEKGLKVTLYSPKHESTAPRFIKKEDELEILQQFLIQPEGLEFTIFLFDKNGKGNPQGFSMIGPSSLSQKLCPAK